MAEQFERTIGGQSLILEVGELAGLASGSVTVRYGDAMLLAVCVVGDKPREGIDFFPLTVDFEERHYAIGKIPGSFFRREGRPGTDAILACRLTDRPIRPLFPKGFRNDVQVVMTILSADRENDLDVLGTVGASVALSMSEAPFAGPISSVRVGYIEGEFLINPTFAEREESDLDLIVAGTNDAVMMVEAGANEVLANWNGYQLGSIAVWGGHDAHGHDREWHLERIDRDRPRTPRPRRRARRLC